jgi:hypothetical protein
VKILIIKTVYNIIISCVHNYSFMLVFVYLKIHTYLIHCWH